jgi:hypothetical protein
MKQKYLVYTLFGLLAVNMSWNLGEPKNSGQVHLASTNGSTFEYEDNGKRITFEQGEVSRRTIVNGSGSKVEKETIELTVRSSEGDTCDCLVNTKITVDVKVVGDEVQFQNLAAVISKAEEDAKVAAQKKKDEDEVKATEAKAKAEEAKKIADEKKKNEMACKLEERQERMDCHAERLTEISEDIKSEGCRTSTDKECTKLLEQYELHKEAIVGYVDELIAESQDEDRKLAKRATTALKILKRSSSTVVKKTVKALLDTDAQFAQVEAQYSKIPELMRAAATTGNPMFGMQATQLQQQLTHMLQYSDVSQYLNRQLDNNYNGGLGEDHVDYFLGRNSTLRKALNIEAIYPTNLGSQMLGSNNSQMTPAINFRGNGFSGNSGAPGSTSTAYANAGVFDLSQPNGTSVVNTNSGSTLVPSGTRQQGRGPIVIN